MENDELWAFLNGKMVRENEAVIPLTDRGVQWGDAVYDSIRTYGGKPFQMPYRIMRVNGVRPCASYIQLTTFLNSPVVFVLPPVRPPAP